MVKSGPWSITDEDSLIECYNASIVEVYRYASRLTGNDRSATDDLVQDVYLGLLRALRNGSVRVVGMGWLITSVRHRFLDRVRTDEREHRRLRLAWSSEPEDAGLADTPDLSTLTDRERFAVVMHYIEDRSVMDVATELGVSVHATESLLARARRRLRVQEV